MTAIVFLERRVKPPRQAPTYVVIPLLAQIPTPPSNMAFGLENARDLLDDAAWSENGFLLRLVDSVGRRQARRMDGRQFIQNDLQVVLASALPSPHHPAIMSALP